MCCEVQRGIHHLIGARPGGAACNQARCETCIVRCRLEDGFRCQVTTDLLGKVADKLTGHDQADAESSSFTPKPGQLFTPADAVRLVEDDEAGQSARLTATKEVAVEPDDQELADG